MSPYFVMAHATARTRAKEAIDQAPDGYIVRISPPKRSLEQNAKLHAELQEIAETIKWAGEYRDIEVWKRLLTAAWARCRSEPVQILPAVDGHGFDVLYQRTSDLSIKEMIDLIEYVQAWRAEHEPS